MRANGQIAAKRQELNAQREQCAAGLSEVEAQKRRSVLQEEALAAARTKADELTAQAQALRAELEALQNSETAAPEEIEAKTAETVRRRNRSCQSGGSGKPGGHAGRDKGAAGSCQKPAGEALSRSTQVLLLS